MLNYETKFWDILTNLFIGAEVEGKSGFANLMKAKYNYYKKVKEDLEGEIATALKDQPAFKDELYDKLYSFFHRYFNDSGSIYYSYSPFFYNIYDKAYDDTKGNIGGHAGRDQTYVHDYEQIKSPKQDTALFYKTNMLFYVKSDKLFKDLVITLNDQKYSFNVQNMGQKYANEKRALVYELTTINEDSLDFEVSYSEKGRKTKLDEIIKQLKANKINLGEEDLTKAFTVFEKQANIDYFINKDAKKFLSEQLDMWLFQYMFAQQVEFDQTRFNQITYIKQISLKLINFIAQFENELVKIWQKPRFVLNSNLVVTLDRLSAKGFDVKKIESHPNYPQQVEEWQALGMIEDNPSLFGNLTLPIDTKYFKSLQAEIEALFDEQEHDGLLIKSENYQALNTILNRFKGKIDLIYIDPPFNTGDDFDYIDRFQDSTWLSLIENRLEIAKNLLSKKGSLYLHLDYRASHYGRMLLDEKLGAENFLNNIVWSYGSGGKSENYYGRKHETILFYKNDINIFNMLEIGIARGEQKRNNMKKGVDEDGRKFVSIKSNGKLYKYYEDDLITPNDVWIISHLQQKDPERYGFITQKPEKLLERIINASSNKNSYVLDYHMGSGTTVAVAYKLGRKFIGVEMGEHFDTIVLPRMKEALASFGNHEPCGISKELNKEGKLNKGGVFKYYALEQYEQILQTTDYTDLPEAWIDALGIDVVKDCFLFDKKLSNALIKIAEGYKIDLDQLYDQIDLKETIYNMTGKAVRDIDEETVFFKDGNQQPLIAVLKPLLVW